MVFFFPPDDTVCVHEVFTKIVLINNAVHEKVNRKSSSTIFIGLGLFFKLFNKVLCCMQKLILVAIDSVYVWEQGSIPVQMLLFVVTAGEIGINK